MFMKLMIKNCFVLIALLSFTSCVNVKSVPYFQNSAEFDGSKDAMLYDMKVKPKDKLTIFVFSGMDKEAVAPFNI